MSVSLNNSNEVKNVNWSYISMERIIFYACSCEELTRYACESIKSTAKHSLNIINHCNIEGLLDECGVIYFCDTSSQRWGQKHYGRTVISPAQLKECEFDKICILSFTHVNQIFQTLTTELGIPEEKIERKHIDFIYRARERFVYNIAEFMKARGISGNVAEGGVYKGEFSKVINDAFPESKLYLFDTFEGFDPRDLCVEKDRGFSQEAAGHFCETSVELVLGRMPYPENCRVHKGYFPDTARDLERRFCFVNLDLDLYLPIYHGLHLLKDKMTPEGVILVHDYFASGYKGARAAVDQFLSECGGTIHGYPIGDNASILLVGQWN